MKREEQRDRWESVMRLHEEGLTRKQIGSRVGLTPDRVGAVLRRMGVVFESQGPAYEISDIWNMPEDERREHIIRRAATAARQARLAAAQSFPRNSHPLPTGAQSLEALGKSR